MFFTADDGTYGRELWTSDGTEAGRLLVEDIDLDRRRSRSSDMLFRLTDVGGRCYVTVEDGVHGRELWTSDGTEAGTVLVEDIDPYDGYDTGLPA